MLLRFIPALLACTALLAAADSGFDETRKRLRELEKAKPLPAAELLRAAEAGLALPSLEAWQRLELISFAEKAVHAEKGNAGLAGYLAAVVQAAPAGDTDYLGELLLRLARVQEPAEALKTCERLAALPTAGPGLQATARLQQMRIHERNRRTNEALAALEQGLPLSEAAAAAAWKFRWDTLDNLRWGAGFARRQQHIPLAERAIAALAGAGDAGWAASAKLELAAVRADQKRFAEAEALYDEVAAIDERRAREAMLPRALLVYRTMGDTARGLPLLKQALMTEGIEARLRHDVVFEEGRRTLARGDRDGAVSWFVQIETLPAKPADQARAWSRALVEIGQIAESRADTTTAKLQYQRALDLADGDLGARLRAREALESIRYFE
jgi:tetratricopeptide (TPR) repeat protein